MLALIAVTGLASELILRTADKCADVGIKHEAISTRIGGIAEYVAVGIFREYSSLPSSSSDLIDLSDLKPNRIVLGFISSQQNPAHIKRSNTHSRIYQTWNPRLWGLKIAFPTPSPNPELGGCGGAAVCDIDLAVYDNALSRFAECYGRREFNRDLSRFYGLKSIKILAGGIRCSLSRAALPPSQPSIDDNGEKREKVNNKYFLVVGIILFSLGVVFLLKVWWSLSFNSSSNINAAGYVALVIVCAVVIWIGMALIGLSFDVFSFASFHSQQSVCQISKYAS